MFCGVGGWLMGVGGDGFGSGVHVGMVGVGGWVTGDGLWDISRLWAVSIGSVALGVVRGVLRKFGGL